MKEINDDYDELYLLITVLKSKLLMKNKSEARRVINKMILAIERIRRKIRCL